MYPYRARAIFDFSSDHDEDLHFSSGQEVLVVGEIDDEWLEGERILANDQRLFGMFPKAFVERIHEVVELPSPGPGPDARTSIHSKAEPDVVLSCVSTSLISSPPSQSKLMESSSKKTSLTTDSHPTLNSPSTISADPSQISSSLLLDRQHPEPFDLKVVLPQDHRVSKQGSSTVASFKDRIAAFDAKAEPSPVASVKLRYPPKALQNSSMPTTSYAIEGAKDATDSQKTMSIAGTARSERDHVPHPLSKQREDDHAALGSLKERIAALQAEQIARVRDLERGEAGAMRMADDAKEFPESKKLQQGSTPPELPIASIAMDDRAESMGISRPTQFYRLDESAGSIRETAVDDVLVSPNTDTSDLKSAAYSSEADENDRRNRLRERMARMSGMGMGMAMSLALDPNRAVKTSAADHTKNQSVSVTTARSRSTSLTKHAEESEPEQRNYKATSIEDEITTSGRSEPDNSVAGTTQGQYDESESQSISSRRHFRDETDASDEASSSSKGHLSDEEKRAPEQESDSLDIAEEEAIIAQEPEKMLSLEHPMGTTSQASQDPSSGTAEHSLRLPSDLSTVSIEPGAIRRSNTRPQIPLPPPSIQSDLTSPHAESDLARDGHSCSAETLRVMEERQNSTQHIGLVNTGIPPGLSQPPPRPSARPPPPVPGTSLPRKRAPDIPSRNQDSTLASYDAYEPLKSEYDKRDRADRAVETFDQGPPERTSRSIDRTSEVSNDDQATSRPSQDTHIIVSSVVDSLAQDLDLEDDAAWWNEADGLPIALRQRTDILVSRNASEAQGQIGKSIRVLYVDLSQTYITIQFNGANHNRPLLRQQHRSPPPVPSRESLETFNLQFAQSILTKAQATTSKNTNHSGENESIAKLVFACIPDLLPPIGNNSYGYTIYTNYANAAITSIDAIRSGDVVLFRSAQFAGTKGPLKSKYTIKAGNPVQCAVVNEWDGAKKKLRCIELNKDRKVVNNSYKLNELKSGEVHVFRPIPRKYIDWLGKSG